MGDVLVGEPIPAAQLDRARYEIRWVADAQPFEAFRIADPPVIAVIHGGPFEQWAQHDVGPLEPDRFADEALAFAKAGAPVAWILIEERGPTTPEGIGVGSSWDAVVAAYPGATVSHSPEWFEPRPTCRVQPKGTIDLQFLLSRCDGENGPVRRVLVTRAAHF